jgi:putative membrane protein
MKLILRVLINAFAIWLTAMLLDSFNFQGNFLNLLVVAIIFGLVNGIVRPIIKFFTLPITIITLGFFTLVINAIMLSLTVWLSNALSLTGSLFENIFVTFLAAIIISVISTVLSWFLPD